MINEQEKQKDIELIDCLLIYLFIIGASSFVQTSHKPTKPNKLSDQTQQVKQPINQTHLCQAPSPPPQPSTSLQTRTAFLARTDLPLELLSPTASQTEKPCERCSPAAFLSA